MKLFGGTYPSIFKTQSVVLYILISPHLLYSGSFQIYCWQIFSIFGEKAPKNTNHLKVKIYLPRISEALSTGKAMRIRFIVAVVKSEVIHA